ncbi:hypothetical protein F5J12DRAFT_783585 [Pisolithus orientalis]|uniref:uncharacterized protein n=1 Tax=Pisolithus orientalis TaxID=936130 RepID=UPI002224B418|nr:uncharacterized protein F5J12DRAFT_783585 [Pisolithus orientalis]KAI6003525.1 hypothetical protein F5J12DRAFT_783585 [Pisolithus orientalis]
MLSFPSISCWLKDKAFPKVLSIEDDVLLKLGLPELIGMDVQPPVQMNTLAALSHPSNPTHTTDHPLPQLLDLSPKQSPAMESQGLQHPLWWASLPSSLNIPPTEVLIVLSQDSSTLVDDRLQATSTMIVTKGKDIDVLEKHQGHQVAPSHQSLSQVLCETAWRQWKSTICEILLQVSAIIPGELARKASPYAKMFFMNDDTRLFTDKVIIQWKNNICINQHLKDFHVNFWYTAELNPMKVRATKDIHTMALWMCALTTVVLFYAIKCESEHVREMLPHVAFMGTEYSPIYEVYYCSLLKATQNPLSAWQLITICCGFINADFEYSMYISMS